MHDEQITKTLKMLIDTFNFRKGIFLTFVSFASFYKCYRNKWHEKSFLSDFNLISFISFE